jgi:hypothetical protein
MISLMTKPASERVAWLLAALALLWFAFAGALQSAPTPDAAPLPEFLHDTGLFVAGSRSQIDPRNLSFAPQYPLWSDGASKRRWLRLPEGERIDATRADAWRFPVGTRFWKEFSSGRRLETRYMEVLADGSFRYATYVWSEDGSSARLAPPAGVAGEHDVPSQADCRACHEGRRSSVLGFSALQLSPDRDPNAPHAEPVPPGGVDLRDLADRGLLVGLDPRWLREAPRIEATSPTARAALGYLYGNCSSCHNASGPLASLGMDLEWRPIETAVGKPSRFVIPGQPRTLRVAAGNPDASAVLYRMSSRFAATQMPPLGTKHVDAQAIALVRAWITQDLVTPTNGKREVL